VSFSAMAAAYCSGTFKGVPFFVIPAKAGTYDKVECLPMVAVGTGLRRYDEMIGYQMNTAQHLFVCVVPQPLPW